MRAKQAAMGVDITSGRIQMSVLVKLAKNLASEDGENPEYNRALVELLTDAANCPMDKREAVAKAAGIKWRDRGN